MFKKVDRYMLMLFFKILLVITISVGLIIIIMNMIERLNYFIENEMPFLQIVEYYIYFGGWVIKSFFPVFVLLSTLFTFSLLARKNEVLAMKASGLSLYRIALPFLLVSLLLSAGHFYYNEYIFPPANKKRVEIKEFDVKKRSRKRYERVTNVSRQIQPGYFYTMAVFNVPRKEGTDIKIYKTENNKLLELITASTVTYKNNQWIAFNGVARSFNDTTTEMYSVFDTLTLVDIADTPGDLAKRVGKPEDMGYDELKSYIALMKRAGSPYVREAIDLQIKFSFPLANFIVVLLSIPFASNPKRGGVAVSFAVGTLIALIYFVLFRVLQSAGYNEKIPDYVAIWGVNALFFVFGCIAFIKARK